MSIREKISGLTPEQIIKKGIRWAVLKSRNFISEIWARTGTLEVRQSRLQRLVTGNPLTPADAASKIFEGMTDVAGITEGQIAYAKERFPGEVSALINDADRLVAKKFRILGKEIDFSKGIRWNYDPANEHEFDHTTYYKRIAYSDPDGGFDIKYPWELSRLQHIPRLALAFRLTSDSRYINALTEQVSDWIKNNPTGFGPNWACTMDVALRAANLALAVAFSADAKFPPDFSVTLASSLVAHGRFISDNLEWSEGLTGNHYLSGIAGLAVLGIMLAPNIPEAVEWRDFAREELLIEMGKQVYEDGWDFEASTAYQRLVMECFLIPAILFHRAGINLDKKYLERLKKMAGFVRDITLPDGSFPLIGDNDSGLFVSLHPRGLDDLRYLCNLAAAFFNDENLKVPDFAEGRTPEIFWLLGLESMDRFESLAVSDRGSLAAYPDGGFWCLRSDDGKDLLTFRLGPVGQNGNGGHAHNDQLSVTVWFGEKPVIIDPGTAVYTSDPAKRNLYRSTGSHATISIDDEDQNRFTPGNLFTLQQDVSTEFAGIEMESGSYVIGGRLSGYGPWPAEEVTMHRWIKHDRNRRQFEIVDEITIPDDVSYDRVSWNFPLAPGLRAEIRGSARILILSDEGNEIAEILFRTGMKPEIDKTSFAAEYGREVPNVTVRFSPPPDFSRARFIVRGF